MCKYDHKSMKTYYTNACKNIVHKSCNIECIEICMKPSQLRVMLPNETKYKVSIVEEGGQDHIRNWSFIIICLET